MMGVTTNWDVEIYIPHMCQQALTFLLEASKATEDPNTLRHIAFTWSHLNANPEVDLLCKFS